MPHADEGLLHAWLDGGLQAMSDAGALPNGFTPADIDAHLRACADCRARLEQERAIRERAGIVLRDAALPAVDAPPFEMIAQRTPAPRRRTWLPLAWAASVLLAIGAGWWGSELWRVERAVMIESASAPAPAAQSSSDVARAEASAVEAGDNVPADAAQQRNPRVEDRAVAAAPAPQAEDAPVAPAVVETTADALKVAAAPPPPAAPPPAVARAEGVPPVVTGQRGDTLFIVAGAPQPRERGAADAVQEQRVTQAIVPRPLGASVAALAADTPPTRFAVAPDALARFRDNVRRARDGEFEWVPQGLDELQRSGTPALMVRAAAEPRVDAAVDATPARLLRVRQRLDSGDELELMLWRVATTDDETAVAAPGAPPRIERQRRRVEEPGAERAAVAVTIVAQSELGDGRREVVALIPSLGTYVAASARLDDATLRDIVQRLVPVH